MDSFSCFDLFLILSRAFVMFVLSSLHAIGARFDFTHNMVSSCHLCANWVAWIKTFALDCMASVYNIKVNKWILMSIIVVRVLVSIVRIDR